MDGVQLAGLFNLTKGLLIGTQIGLFNFANRIEGKNSHQRGDLTAVQIGFFNRAKKMNGLQIGIIKMGGTSQGAMVGLINIYKNGKHFNYGISGQEGLNDYPYNSIKLSLVYKLPDKLIIKNSQ